MTTQQPGAGASRQSGPAKNSSAYPNRYKRNNHNNQRRNNNGVRTVRRVDDNASRTGIVRKPSSLDRVPVQHRSYKSVSSRTQRSVGMHKNTSNRRRDDNSRSAGRGQRRPSRARNQSLGENKTFSTLIENYFNVKPIPDSVKNDINSLSPLKDGDIRIVPVCGVEGIGTNMTFVEYKDEIVVIDAGFGFSNPDTPGIS